MQYWITSHPKTAIQAFNSESCSIVQIKKQEDGETLTKAFLAVIVTELIESFNVGKTMNDMQVGFLVNGIQADYYFLKIDELKFCFEEAKKGRYGTMYDRIDAAVVFGWIEQYMEERSWICITENSNKSSSYKSEPTPAAIVDILKAQVKISEQTKRVEIPKREPTEDEILCRDILKEFDKLHRDKPYDPEESMRTIPYQNRNLTQTEFLTIRLEELNKI